MAPFVDVLTFLFFCTYFHQVWAEELRVIPLTVASNGRYLVSVNMSSTAPRQFQFALTTSSGFTGVAGTGCSNCNGAPSFNVSSSSSAKPLAQGQHTVAVGDSDDSYTGQVIKEDCSLKQKTGSWNYPNQTIVVVDNTTSMFSPDTSGLLGLGTNKRINQFIDSIFGSFFARKPNETSFTFGMALTPTRGAKPGDAAGVIHWENTDPSAYKGQLAKQNVMANSSADWTITMDKWAFISGSGETVTNTRRDLPATIDPFFPNIYFPFADATLLYASVPGAQRRPGFGQSPTSIIWQLPCDTKMSLSMSFSSQSFILQESVLVIRSGNNTCVGAIQGWPDPSQSDYLLGAAFISSVYLVFGVNANSPDSIGIAQRALHGQSTLSGGAIAGIVVGSVTLTAAVGLVAFFIYYRRQRLQQEEEAEKGVEVGHTQPFLQMGASSPMNSPMPSQGMGTMFDAQRTPVNPQEASLPSEGPLEMSVERIPRSAPPTTSSFAGPSTSAQSPQSVRMSAPPNMDIEMDAYGGAPPPSFAEATRGAHPPPGPASSSSARPEKS